MNIDISVIIALVGGLVALTNVITEVLKKVAWDKLPTNVLALIVAEALTIVAGLAYFQINDITVVWYMAVALVVLGIMVAYAAMFGFDKLKEIMGWGGNKSENQ